MDTVSRLTPVVMIAGIPGAGKSVLAAALQEHFGGVLISTGDIARRVDPAGVGAGELAEETLFREAFYEELGGAMHSGPKPVWLDGFPRSEHQLGYVTGSLDESQYSLLVVTARSDIARDRQLRRGREGDTPEIVAKRTAEQAALLEVDLVDGWIYAAPRYGAIVNTDYKRPEAVAAGFIAYLRGIKREAY